MRLCLLFGLLLFCPKVFASLPETPQFRQLTVADGLPSSTLYAITQDKKGYLWIASKDGLARYDGVGYKTYRYAPGDDNALPGNVVQALHIDSRDQLWLAMEGHGVSRLNAERNDFSHIRKSTHPALGSDDIWAIASTPDGGIWLGSYGGGLHRMDELGRIKRFMPVKNDPNSLPSDTVLSLTVDAKNRLWIGTTKGLCFWNGKDFVRIHADKVLDSYVMQLIGDADGGVWAGTLRGLVHVSAAGRQIGEVLLPGKPITGLWQDKQGAVWFSDGPSIYQWRDGQLLSYVPDSQTRAKVYGVFEDHEGGFWFPTEDRGLLRLPAGWRNFSVFRHQSNDVHSLSGVVVNAASQMNADNAWLVNDAGGLDKINLATGRIERVLDSKQTSAPLLWSVLQTRDGSVWMGHSNGMMRFDPDSGVIKHFPRGEGPQDTLPGAVRLLMQTKDGLLWSASYGGGIQARDETGKVIHRILADERQDLSLADPDQFSLSPDGQLWVATAKGLLRWDDDAEKFIDIEGGPKERIDAFSFLTAETVWTHRMGVLEAFLWNGKSLQSIRKITGDEGLPPVEVGSMLTDRSGNLWLTTTRGLLRYNALTDQLRMFGERDGLPSQEFNMQPAYMTPQGVALVSTSNGLVVLDTARIRNQTSFSPLNVDALSVRRGEDITSFPAAASTVELQSGDRDFNVSLRLLSFADATAHRYRFRLKNYDNDWVDAGSSGERMFSSLPPGKYLLEAKAADAEGRWSEPLSMKLIVLPPWWMTRWALTIWGLLAALLFLTSAWLYQRRVHKINARRMREHEREMVERNSSAKSRFLATLGHEIRTPMTGVLGMAELLQAGELNPVQRHRVGSIQSAGQHLLHLVNDVLDLAQIEAGKLRLIEEAFDPKALVVEVSEFLKPLAEAKGLVFAMVIDKSTPRFCRGDVGRVRQILLNLGSNAIKFTEQGQVIVRCAGMPIGGIQLQVSDTGPGMSLEQQARLFQRFEQAEGNRTSQLYGGSGLGLAICQELAMAMSGGIEVKSSPGLGASFIVNLPLPVLEVISGKKEVCTENREIGEASLKILLVEDEPMVAEVVTGLLQAIGHRASHAQHGLQALSMLAVENFDFALLDLDLPGIDGFELARLIRLQGYGLPLVAITARSDAFAEPAAMAAGMKAFIRKPVNAAELRALLLSLRVTDQLE